MSTAVGGREDEHRSEPKPLPEPAPLPEDLPAGAADRLVRFAYGVGIPARLLTRPFGRAPRLRLLATVENPLPGNRAVGMALRAGHFLVLGSTRRDAGLQALAPGSPHRGQLRRRGGGGGLLPAALEQGLRATAAHSTLMLDDAKSSAIMSGGRIGRGVGTVDVEREVVRPTRSVRGEAHLALPDGSDWRFAATAGTLRVEDSIWVDGGGAPVPIRQLVLHDVVGRAGGAFSWRFSSMEQVDQGPYRYD